MAIRQRDIDAIAADREIGDGDTAKVDPFGTVNDTLVSAGKVSLGCRSRRMLRCSSALLSVENWRPP